MSGRWVSSKRRAQLPNDWAGRVARTRAEANGLCQADQHVASCDGIGSECDHRSDPDNHDDLQWLSTPCHAAKTQREARAAQPKRRRTPEPHPGRLA